MQTLRKARENAGLTQGQVARRIGAYASFVSKAESGERRLDILEFLAICKLYKVDPVAILGITGLL
ncbi:MAG: helix-turn-helix transcriptional regulator [Gemmatales bacterium]